MTKSGAFGRLFCFGMPKCGTTSVAALLDSHPAICLHAQKEPGEFLHRPVEKSLAGYRTSEETQFLADFTTHYGLRGNRERFVEGLELAGIVPRDARYVICLRDPQDLAASYLRHIAERRWIEGEAQLAAVADEVASACDFAGALSFLIERAGHEAIFVAKFTDIADEQGQKALMANFCDWLDLSTARFAEPIWANAAGSIGRYPPQIESLAIRFRRTDLAKALSPQIRGRIRNVFVRTGEGRTISEEFVNRVLANLAGSEDVQRSREVLTQLRSGPLDPDRSLPDS